MLSRVASSFIRPVPALVRTLATKLGPGGLELKSLVEKKLAEQKKKIAAFRKEHESTIIDQVTVGQAYGGMRGIKSMITETSLLDAEEGIRFRGYSIPECQELLPKAKGGEQPLPEGILWLLLTGEIPSEAQVARLTEEMHRLAPLPPHVIPLIDSLPKTMHPMTQFSTAVLALQTESAFAEGYRNGMPKSDYFEKTYEDVITLLARLPEVAARIYANCFKDGAMKPYDKTKDWGANFAQMMGFDKDIFHDMMRMYLVIHSDHEGGNVSAHTTHLVGSALSDPYLSFSAGLNGLAGPLHGLANQEVLRFLREVISKVGPTPTADELKKMVQGLIEGKKVVPGYGHAVLRKTDPRYVCQREFCLKHLPEDPMFKIVSNLYKVTPPILSSVAKIKNPWPNVDAHSGVLLQHFGMVEEDFYTVLFGVSRAIGVLAQLVWARGLGLPIERPKSMTTELCMKFAKKN